MPPILAMEFCGLLIKRRLINIPYAMKFRGLKLCICLAGRSQTPFATIKIGLDFFDDFLSNLNGVYLQRYVTVFWPERKFRDLRLQPINEQDFRMYIL